MTWLNPFAFIGLLAIAIPVLVHLFGRRRARTQRFPSLRLLSSMRPTPATRSRPSDVLLLVVRTMIIAAAVAALAQPRWFTAGRRREWTVPVRVVIVDTSASMRRPTSDGRSAVAKARSAAAGLADSARAALVVESNRPGADAAGAASWLSARGGMRELVVISDFQAGTVADGDLAQVPAEAGLRFIRVAGVGDMADTSGRVEALPDRTVATWRAASGAVDTTLQVFAAEDERDAVSAALAAARETIGSVARGLHRVQIVFPRSPRRAELATSAKPLDSAWQGDVLLSLRSDPVLSAIAAETLVPPCELHGTPIVPNGSGTGVAQVAGSSRESDALLVLSCVDASSLAGAALVARTIAAMTSAPGFEELEPSVLPDEQLRRWERPGAVGPPTGVDEESPDGRWFWLLAVALLLVEEWLRRKPVRQADVAREERHARVA